MRSFGSATDLTHVVVESFGDGLGEHLVVDVDVEFEAVDVLVDGLAKRVEQGRIRPGADVLAELPYLPSFSQERFRA